MESELKTAINQFVDIAELYADAKNRTERIEAAIADWLLERLRDHGVTLPEQRLREILEIDVVLNTQGIEFWLDHRQ